MGLFVTLRLLRKHVGVLSIGSFVPHHLRVLGASLLAMIPVYAIVHFEEWSSVDTSVGIRAARLLFVMVVSGVGYLFAARAFKIEEISALAGFASGLIRRDRKSR